MSRAPQPHDGTDTQARWLYLEVSQRSAKARARRYTTDLRLRAAPMLEVLQVGRCVYRDKPYHLTHKAAMLEEAGCAATEAPVQGTLSNEAQRSDLFART